MAYYSKTSTITVESKIICEYECEQCNEKNTIVQFIRSKAEYSNISSNDKVTQLSESAKEELTEKAIAKQEKKINDHKKRIVENDFELIDYKKCKKCAAYQSWMKYSGNQVIGMIVSLIFILLVLGGELGLYGSNIGEFGQLFFLIVQAFSFIFFIVSISHAVQNLRVKKVLETVKEKKMPSVTFSEIYFK